MHAIKLIKNGVKIGQQEYHIGDILTAKDENGEIQYKGRIAFEMYFGDGLQARFHLGFVVENSEDPYTKYTLLDLLETGWKIDLNRSEDKNYE